MKQWPTRSLGELCDVEGGNAAPQGDDNFKDGTIPFVRMKDLGRTHFTTNLSETDDKLTEASASANRMKFFDPGCILFPRSGSVALNHRAILGVRACIVSHIGVLQNLRPEVTTGYLYLYLTTFDMTALSKKTTGVDSIAFADVKRIPIPVPPLAEQERIVKLLGEADELRKLRAQADRRTAALIPALFHEMFGSLWEAAARFPVSKLGQITRFIDYRGISPNKSDSGVRLVTARNIKRGYFENEPQEFIPAEEYESWMCRGMPREGDVLFTTEGHTLGSAAILPPFKKAALAQRLIAIQPNAELDSYYLLQTVLSPVFQKEVANRSTGSAARGISSKNLAEVPIPVPPLSLQTEFAQRVTEIRALEAAQAASRQRLEALFQSMLHRAFNGEL
jgi:type I restriction enzyme, S subunit